MTKFSSTESPLSFFSASFAEYDREAYKKGLVATFGPGSPYDYEKTGKPAQGPWLTTAMKKFLANVAEGVQEAGSTTCKDVSLGHTIYRKASSRGAYGHDPF